jgi:uncharacterized membrane protein
MDLARQDHTTYELFRIGILLKGANALLEIIGGTLLAFANPSLVTQFVVLFTQEELSEDPHDSVANYLLQIAQGYSVSTQIFGAAYLLVHGIVKIVLVWALLKNNGTCRIRSFRSLSSLSVLVHTLARACRTHHIRPHHNRAHLAGICCRTQTPSVKVIGKGYET